MGNCETKPSDLKDGNIEGTDEDPTSAQGDENKNPGHPIHNIPPVDHNDVRPSHQISEGQGEEVVEAPKQSGRNSNYPKIKAGRPSQVKSSSPEERKNRATQSKGVSDFRSKLPENIKKTLDKSTTPEKDRHKKLQAHDDPRKKKEQNGINLIYSNEALQDISNIVHPELLQVEDPDVVLLEGPLLKYRPGTTFFWVERWCVITKTEFRYYKAQWHAACPDMKPLFSVPISQIQIVFRVMLDLPKLQQKKNFLASDQKKYQELYQFEIFNNLTDYPYYDEILNREIIEGDENEQLKPEFNVDSMENFKLWKKYDDEQRSKINSPKKIRKGYLMRPPVVTKNYTKTPQGALVSRESYYPGPTETNESPEKVRNVEGGSPERSSKKPSPAKKAVYKWVKQKIDMISWTNREREWYYSEKRLLFATPKIDHREKWLAVLHWLVEENNKHTEKQDE